MDYFDNIFDDTLLDRVVLDLRPIILEHINIIYELSMPNIKIEKINIDVSEHHDLIIKGKDVCCGLVYAIRLAIMDNCNSTRNPQYTLITSTEYNLCFVEGFDDACLNLSTKLEYLEKYVKDTYENDPEYQKNHIYVKMNIETQMIGCLLTNILEKSGCLMMATYCAPRSFDGIIFELKIRDDSKFLPIEILIESIKWGKNMFDVILKQWK